MARQKKEAIFTHPKEAKIFAAHFRKVRIAQGMTQEGLAFEAGVARSTISRIEAAEQNLTLDMMFTLSKALSIPTRELFDY